MFDQAHDTAEAPYNAMTGNAYQGKNVNTLRAAKVGAGC